jgi:hypothetical protein
MRRRLTKPFESASAIKRDLSCHGYRSDEPATLMTDAVEKLYFLPRSQFLRQHAGFKKKALSARQKG